MKNALSILLVLNSISTVAFADEQLAPTSSLIKKYSDTSGALFLGASGVSAMAGSMIKPTDQAVKVLVANDQARALEWRLNSLKTVQERFVSLPAESRKNSTTLRLENLQAIKNMRNFSEIKTPAMETALKKYSDLSMELFYEQIRHQNFFDRQKLRPELKQEFVPAARSEKIITDELNALDAKIRETHIKPALGKSPLKVELKAMSRKATLNKFAVGMGVAGVAAIGVGMLAGTLDGDASTTAINPGQDAAMYNQLQDLEASRSNPSTSNNVTQSAPAAATSNW